MCSQIDAKLQILSGTYRAMKFNTAPSNEGMSVLSFFSYNEETMTNIFSGHIKMNCSCGGHKHRLLAGQWKIYYHIDYFFQNEFPSLVHKNVHTNKGWEASNSIH